MRYILSILLVLAASCPAISQITRAEYFLDTDPGYGSASTVTMPSGNDVSKMYLLALSSASEGFHSVSLRAQDAQGHWSHTLSHSFYVLSGIAASITTNEYFIDTDPGYGKATPVTGNITGDSSLKLVIPLSSYSTGFHTIGLRSKDDQGKWSQTLQHVFYVTANNAAVNITSLEYYFVADSTRSEVYTYRLATPSLNADLNFTADLSKLPGDKLYDMHIWAVNADSVRSEVLIKKVKVCSGEVAKAKFDFVQAGTQVSFIDNSSGVSKYQWNFGDSKIDSVSNPLHNYTTVGNYNVRLVVSNFCNTDTFKTLVSVVGLKAINTNHGGNTGSVTVNVTGAGFVPGMQLYLHQSGQPDITGDTLLISNVGEVMTTFDLKGKTLGLYDVIAVFPDTKRDTLHNGFTVEKGTAPKLWVNIAGDGVLRIGFNQVYTVTYGNSGNTDAEFIPIAIGGLPIGTDIEISNPLLNINKLSVNDTIRYVPDNLRRTIDDSAKNMSFRIFYINKIPGNSQASLSFIFHLPITTKLHSYPKIQVLLGEPMFQSVYKSKINRLQKMAEELPTPGSCIRGLLKYAATIAIGEANILKPYQECALGLIDSYTTILDLIEHAMNSESALNTGAHVTLDFIDFNKKFVETTFSCAQAAGLTVEAPEILTGKLVKIAATVAWDALVKYQEVYECGKSFFNVIKYQFAPIIGNAWDPNSKYGSGDSSSLHYINANPLTYVINFENDPAANLNAQTVTVIDTLKSAYYDYKSFGFTSVTIGDSVYSLNSPAKSFIHDFDFTSQYGVKARITALFDTTTGIAQWKFLTIDPVTNQVTTNALAGFLPPDVNSPKGQGYVSYTVNPNANIRSGDTAYNKATIKFDYNPVITTNNWQNTFDLINPTSHIQSLPAETYDTTFRVHWSGADNASGIRSYDVYSARNNGTFQLWLSDVSSTDSLFTGQVDSTYSFYSIATDNAGNIENAKGTGETFTHIIAGTLPISLLSFSAHLSGSNSILDWATANEQNSSHFILERSTDGINFTSIGLIKAAGNSGRTLTYNYTDLNVLQLNQNKIYYRLQQVDKDGKLKYSPVITLNMISQAFDMKVMPNPVRNEVNLTFTLLKQQSCDIMIMDAQGKTIIMDKKSLVQGTNLLRYNTSVWAQGIYVIKVVTADGTIKTFKIVKQ